jgi:hypothetical protein
VRAECERTPVDPDVLLPVLDVDRLTTEHGEVDHDAVARMVAAAAGLATVPYHFPDLGQGFRELTPFKSNDGLQEALERIVGLRPC